MGDFVSQMIAAATAQKVREAENYVSVLEEELRALLSRVPNAKKLQALSAYTAALAAVIQDLRDQLPKPGPGANLAVVPDLKV